MSRQRQAGTGHTDTGSQRTGTSDIDQSKSKLVGRDVRWDLYRGGEACARPPLVLPDITRPGLAGTQPSLWLPKNKHTHTHTDRLIGGTHRLTVDTVHTEAGLSPSRVAGGRVTLGIRRMSAPNRVRAAHAREARGAGDG